MRRSELHYSLPPERIAQHPCEPRDAAKLMVVDRSTGAIENRIFRDLPNLLRPNDCLVLNVTRVLPAKFEARRPTGGRLDGLFLHESAPGRWRVLLRGIGRIKPNEHLTLGEGRWHLTIDSRADRGECEATVSPPDAASVVLAEIGAPPLPPYIARADSADADHDRDRDDYQTVFASVPGAVAAPTAGLHFTTGLLEKIRAMGISTAEVVLHVGLGTFQPIEVDDLVDHPMHAEWYSISASAARTINAARTAGGRIIAVGTTSVRVLETVARDGPVREASGWTRIFIYPPYQFRAFDALITNFHLPESTLLALVYAFAGPELTMTAYQCALRDGYRFFSYGDAMLIA